MSEKDDKWQYVEGVIKKDPDASPQEISQHMTLPVSKLEEADGIIARFKQGQVQRKQSIELLKAWYDSQLEVTKYQLGQAVRLKKKETDVDVERYLTDLNKRHLYHLQELKFKNLDQRFAALDELGEKTARMLEKIKGRDWPENIKEDTINGIIKLQTNFFEKVMEE